MGVWKIWVHLLFIVYANFFFFFLMLLSGRMGRKLDWSWFSSIKMSSRELDLWQESRQEGILAQVLCLCCYAVLNNSGSMLMHLNICVIVD